MELLAEYTRHGSEDAFAELVQRHISLVYSTALRHVGVAAQAEEIVQVVFVILARKAGGLHPATILEGWLHETTRLSALRFLRGERRRQFREQEVYMQSNLPEDPDNSAWNEIFPLLDEALGRLKKRDRDVVILRYFKEKSVRDVADAMQIKESAAQRRILRALEKLRSFFATRGVYSTTAIIAGAITANSVQAAPAALAQSVAAAAIASGAATSTSNLTIIKGALKIMAWTKAKTAVVTGVIVLFAAAATTVTVKEVQEHKTYPWQSRNYHDWGGLPEQVTIVPTKFPNWGPNNWPGLSAEDGSFAWGLHYPIEGIVAFAYGTAPNRTIVSPDVPNDRYDFVAKMHGGVKQALAEQLAKRFGVTGVFEDYETNVLALRLEDPGAYETKFQTRRRPAQTINFNRNSIQANGVPMSTLTDYLTGQCGMPVVDQTGLSGLYNLSLRWNDPPSSSNLEGLKQALENQLGLQLVSTDMPIQMLVVKRVK